MMSGSFVQRSDLFSYNVLKCLRNAYHFNDCTLCIDLCPENAFSIVRNKLMLSDKKCIDCAACVGSCPTEALMIRGFNPNAYAMNFNRLKESGISCQKSIPCLGVFDAHHYIIMALRSFDTPTCDMAHCGECPLNENGAVESVIREKISAANNFLAGAGSEKYIGMNEEKSEQNERRVFFRKALDAAKETLITDADISAAGFEKTEYSDADTPFKLLLLSSTVKENLENLKKVQSEKSGTVFFNKAVSFDLCSLCGDCIQFCPTKALESTTDGQGIMFTQAKCIGCGICNHICKTDAMVSEDGFDLVEIAHKRARQLIRYDMAVCRECRCYYPYKGGEALCERCSGFKMEFSDMFVLAKDQQIIE